MALLTIALSMSACKKTEQDSDGQKEVNSTVTSTPQSENHETDNEGDTTGDTIRTEFTGLSQEDIRIETDRLMQQVLIEKDNDIIKEWSESVQASEIQLTDYVKTISSHWIPNITKDGHAYNAVQLFWECGNSANPYEFEWFDGSHWLITVFLKDNQPVEYEILPYNEAIRKAALGIGKLMQNGEEAVKLAYKTYLSDDMKTRMSQDSFMTQWNDTTTGMGSYEGTYDMYYGYNATYQYPYAIVYWKYSNASVSMTYQYGMDLAKVIGIVSNPSKDEVNIVYKGIVNKEDQTNPISYALQEVYRDLFPIGVALPAFVIDRWEEYKDRITTDFSSATMENEMKPDYVLNRDACTKGVKDDPAYVTIAFPHCEAAIQKFIENGIQVRYHTLVWHAQTPKWFFYEDYNTEKSLVDAETMKLRMKNYIHQVISYLDETYPGLIYTIDVVNEAFNGSGTYNIKQDDNLWYDTLGYEYVYYAFLYAREAIDASKNMKDVTLIYNDYNMPMKVDIVTNGLESMFLEHDQNVHDYVDGIGFQGHYDTTTSMAMVAEAIRTVCERGYEVQVTELDIGIPNLTSKDTPTQEQLDVQGEKYKSLMQRLVSLKQNGYPITSVTVWGLSDALSWRASMDGKNAYALLLHEDLTYKPAYYGMALDDSVLSYFDMGIDY